jgi:hypothetical protein
VSKLGGNYVSFASIGGVGERGDSRMAHYIQRVRKALNISLRSVLPVSFVTPEKTPAIKPL